VPDFSKSDIGVEKGIYVTKELKMNSYENQYRLDTNQSVLATGRINKQRTSDFSPVNGLPVHRFNRIGGVEWIYVPDFSKWIIIAQ
jgi:hypothetical protein